MIKYICFFVFLLFSIFGFCEMIHLIKIKFIFPKRKMNSQLVIYLDNNTAEQQLIFAGEQYRWLGNKFADSIFANNSNLDFETYLRCKEIAEKYNIIFN